MCFMGLTKLLFKKKRAQLLNLFEIEEQAIRELLDLLLTNFYDKQFVSHSASHTRKKYAILIKYH